VRDELSPYARLVDCVPEGYTPSGFVVSIEALDPEGRPVLVCRMSDDMTAWKGLGMAQALVVDMKEQFQTPAMAEDEDDDLAG